MFIRTYAYVYAHIRACLYAYTRMCIRAYTHIHASLICLCYSDENVSLCFIVVKEKESNKATSRQREIYILRKANGDHVTNTHVASL